MFRLMLRRLFLIPPLLLLVHFGGFAYALVAQRVQASRNPFFAPSLQPSPSLGSSYLAYFQALLAGDGGAIPGGRGPLLPFVVEAARTSLGLLALAFAISLLLGLLLGLYAIHTQPPGPAAWLIPLSTVGLAMPAFYVGIVLVAGMIFYTLTTFSRPPLPFDGFGWDRHLVLPLIALCLRPTLQIAQSTSRLLGEELKQQYVTAARSLGYSWQRIRWRSALRNVLAPIIVTTTGSLRLLLGELLLIELLFNWPGAGRLLALTLIPPATSAASGGFYFLNPPLLALLLSLFTLFLLLVDLLASLLLWQADPRLRVTEGAPARG